MFWTQVKSALRKSLPSPPPPPKLTPDTSLRDFRAWKATWEDYFELSNGPRLTNSHQLALLRTCLSPDMRATLGQTIPARDNLTDQLDEIAGHFRQQRNVALHRVKFEQRHQEHGETFDHFYVAPRELAADADMCGTCLNDRLTTLIMAGVASENLRKKLLAIKPFPRLEDVVARCRSEESATNTEAEITRRPALAVNVVSIRRSALTSAGRSAPTTTPSPRPQPSTPPATKTDCGFCGGRPHQTRSECRAYAAQNALRATGCIILPMTASLGTIRFPHNFKTQCPRTRLMSTLAPLPQLTTLSLLIKMLDIAISCMCAISPPTVVTPSPNPISQMGCCPHSPSSPRPDPRSTYKQLGSMWHHCEDRGTPRVSCAAAQWTWMLAQMAFPSPSARFLRATAAL